MILTLDQRIRRVERDITVLEEYRRKGRRVKRNSRRLVEAYRLLKVLEQVKTLPSVEDQLCRK